MYYLCCIYLCFCNNTTWCRIIIHVDFWWCLFSLHYSFNSAQCPSLPDSGDIKLVTHFSPALFDRSCSLPPTVYFNLYLTEVASANSGQSSIHWRIWNMRYCNLGACMLYWLTLCIGKMYLEQNTMSLIRIYPHRMLKIY